MNIIMKSLRGAIADGNIIAYYQPQYNINTGRLVGAEALVRWKYDDEILLPVSFIPIYEQTSLITELDWHMLSIACKFIEKRKEMSKHYVPISVNFSRKHFRSNEDFVKKASELCDRYGIDHGDTVIEVTETADAEDPKKMHDTIAALQKEGFKVAIDDFGSGTASISTLVYENVDQLKIDRSVMPNYIMQDKEKTVLRFITGMTSALGLQTVVEGVESESQREFLRSLAIEDLIGQGYIYSKPLSEADFEKLLDQEFNE